MQTLFLGGCSYTDIQRKPRKQKVTETNSNTSLAQKLQKVGKTNVIAPKPRSLASSTSKTDEESRNTTK